MDRANAESLKTHVLGMNEKIDELSRVMNNFVRDVRAVSDELNVHVDTIIELNNTELAAIMKEILGAKDGE